MCFSHFVSSVQNLIDRQVFGYSIWINVSYFLTGLLDIHVCLINYCECINFLRNVFTIKILLKSQETLLRILIHLVDDIVSFLDIQTFWELCFFCFLLLKEPVATSGVSINSLAFFKCFQRNVKLLANLFYFNLHLIVNFFILLKDKLLILFKWFDSIQLWLSQFSTL